VRLACACLRLPGDVPSGGAVSPALPVRPRLCPLAARLAHCACRGARTSAALKAQPYGARCRVCPRCLRVKAASARARCVCCRRVAPERDGQRGHVCVLLVLRAHSSSGSGRGDIASPESAHGHPARAGSARPSGASAARTRAPKRAAAAPRRALGRGHPPGLGITRHQASTRRSPWRLSPRTRGRTPPGRGAASAAAAQRVDGR